MSTSVRDSSSAVAEPVAEGPSFLVNEGFFVAVCIVVGVIQAWAARYTMVSDGVSYLDIGDAYFRRDWSVAINAYWSPMYSWCLGLALYVLKPSVWWEYVVVHLVNLVIFVVALFSFRFFLHQVVRSCKYRTFADSVPLPENLLLGLGYALFLLCSIVLIDVGWVSPDLIVAGILFLLCGCLIKLRARHSYATFAIFGVLCGLGYLSKGVMFPLSLGFLAILLFSGAWTKERVYGVIVAGLMFLMVASPFVIALSKAKGRFTYGDTGRLAYAAMVNPSTPDVHWQGEPPGSGTPVHPTRKVLENPDVFEFAQPIRGTYPPWDDPSYWNEGVKAVFQVRAQIRVLVKSALTYEKLLISESGLLAGILIFLFIGGTPTREAIAENWPLVAIAALSICLYSCVLVLPRYVGASITVLWLAVFSGVRVPNDRTSQRISKWVVFAVGVTVLFSVFGYMAETVYNAHIVTRDPPAIDQIKAAAALRNLQIEAGDEVAVIGDGGTNHWARLGRFRIVSESMLAQAFWASPPERRELAYESFRRAGAKAVVAWAPPSVSLDSRWTRLGGTEYYAYSFRK
jgi:hypothetical protein